MACSHRTRAADHCCSCPAASAPALGTGTPCCLVAHDWCRMHDAHSARRSAMLRLGILPLA
eukprot:4186142-Prymnesium_polylepis.1